MKGFTTLLALTCLALAVVPAPAGADPVYTFRTDLLAGKTIDVGDVLVRNDGANLYVRYCLDPFVAADPLDNWYLTQIHLQVATSLAGIPQKNGNPVPGLFTIKKSYDHVLCSEEFVIPLPAGVPTLYIAAHADVEKLGGVADLGLVLPDIVTMKIKFPYVGGPSYFPETTITNGMMLDGSLNTMLNGLYTGWCVDTDHHILQNTPYAARVLSSYDDATGLVEHPENLDLVNWILNQDYVGKASPGGYGNYTYGDVQRAIWTLVDDQLSDSAVWPWSDARVNEIVAAALLEGEGFVPGCDQLVAVLLAPTAGAAVQVIIAQVTLIGLKMPCEAQGETAWGNGLPFPGKNWATYIVYPVQ
jgi:hypothetical protein